MGIVEDKIRDLKTRQAKVLEMGGEKAVAAQREKGKLTAALYELGLALRTQHGQVFSADALTDMLQQAGYSKSNVLTLPTQPFIMGMIEAWS